MNKNNNNNNIYNRTMKTTKKENNVLNDLIQTRRVLNQKLKSLKSNQIDQMNLLENTFKPITNPLNAIAENLNQNTSNKKLNNNHYQQQKQRVEGEEKDEEERLYMKDKRQIKRENFYKGKIVKVKRRRVNYSNAYRNKVNKINGDRYYNTKNKKETEHEYNDDVINLPQQQQQQGEHYFDKVYNDYDRFLLDQMDKHPELLSSIDDNKSSLQSKQQDDSDFSDMTYNDNDKLLFEEMEKQSTPLSSSRKLDTLALKRKDRLSDIDNGDDDEEDGVHTKKFIKNTKENIENQLGSILQKSFKTNGSRYYYPKKKNLIENNEDHKLLLLARDIDDKKRKTNLQLDNSNTLVIPKKRKTKSQQNNQRKQIKLDEIYFNKIEKRIRKLASNKSMLLKNFKLLQKKKQLDMLYGLNVKENGDWYFGNSKLKYNNNTIMMNNIKFKLTPGLFTLLFHVKPINYSKNDLKNYHQILLSTNAHKRKYQSNAQIKGSKSYKYQHIIKHLFKPKLSFIGRGVLTKSYLKKDKEYTYWDDPNELVNRLRLLLASDSAGNKNHKNEIISIIEELKEANIIK